MLSVNAEVNGEVTSEACERSWVNIRQKGGRKRMSEWASLRLRDRIGPASACSSSASTPGFARRCRAITSPGPPTGFGSCCTSRGWSTRELVTKTTTGWRSGAIGITNLVPRPVPGSTISVRPSTWPDGQRSNERFVDSGPSSSHSSGSRFTGRSGHYSERQWRRPRAGSGPGRWASAGDDPWFARVRAAQPERPECQLQLRGDAECIQGAAARGTKSRAGG